MNLISQILQEKRRNSTCALIPFLTAGYPNITTTIEALYTLDKQGADIVELGIPYSDALADGPLIQQSSKVALDQGIYIDQVLGLLNQINGNLNVPIVIFTYYNPILARGLNKFIKEISLLGVRGLIVPDLPIEETDYLICICRNYNIELVLFIAPTSPKSRIKNILSKAPGCVYLVSTTGVTGIRNHINDQIYDLASYIRSNTDKLVMLGFGISSPSQVSKISHWNIDGIVIGSAFTKILSSQHCINNLKSFCFEIKQAIKTTDNH
uniref:Tryptophan synthase alpha chain n=1 Tax=Digenea simplex TaxID=945030 RepID=A0A1Z1MU38_DIGSM|nr:Tryptophan synthase alpha subunit [Digenea simplex]ARW69476.1 Tryptophan synthase alpha subunit [Digenea simplex]